VKPLLIPDARFMEHFVFAIFHSHATVFVSGISGWLSVHCQPSHEAYIALCFSWNCVFCCHVVYS
jgi:hypothetical protein